MTAQPDALVARTMQACFEVRRRLGPGLARETYRDALGHELSAAGLGYQKAVRLPIFYRGVRLADGYELDFCVERRVAVLVHAVPELLPLHRAELRARLRAAGLDHGTAVNFNATRLAEGMVVLRRAVRPSRPAPEHDAADEPTLVRMPANVA